MEHMLVLPKCFDPTVTNFDYCTGRNLGSHNARGNNPSFDGRSRQDDPHGRYEGRDASSSVMEVRIPWLMGCDHHRPHDPPALPDVLCEQLLLHMACVVLDSHYLKRLIL